MSNTSKKAKEDYIKAWQNYIGEIYGLAFCSDIPLSQEIRGHIEALKALVPKVAETKTSWGK
jgi:hypothetical protein